MQQNPIELALVLFVKNNPLDPIVRSDSKEQGLKAFLRKLRSQFGMFRRNARVLFTFFLCKNQLSMKSEVLSLPCYGQTCVPVHKGHKIFDLRRGMVIKVFDRDVSASVVEGEIELLKGVSSLEFAPSIGKWNIQEKWYEEEYLDGTLDSSWKPLDSEALLKKFQSSIVEYLQTLVFFQPQTITTSLKYLDEVSKILPSSGLAKRTSAEKEFSRITAFTESVVERIRMEGDRSIYLTFTHGDFVPANMLNAGKGIKIIDWEGAGPRTVLYDFFSFFFYRSVSRNISIATLVKEIGVAFPMLISRLTQGNPEMANALLSLEHIYRWNFYVENLCRLVKREMTDNQLDILDYILRSIQAFEMYERHKTESYGN